MQSHELESMIFVGPFQLNLFCNSVIGETFVSVGSRKIHVSGHTNSREAVRADSSNAVGILQPSRDGVFTGKHSM